MTCEACGDVLEDDATTIGRFHRRCVDRLLNASPPEPQARPSG